MKRFGFVLVLFLIVSLGVFAQENVEKSENVDEVLVEEVKEVKEIKPDVNFSFLTIVEVQSTDGKLNAAPVSSYGDMTFIQNKAKLSVSLPVADNITITPWIAERFDTRLNYVSSAIAGDPDTVAFRGRNRVYLGLTSSFAVPNIMDIAFDLEYRIANDLRPNNVATAANNVENRFSPAIILGGGYDFGFYWSLYQQFSMYLNARNSTPLEGWEFTGEYTLGYNLLNEVDSVDNSKYGLNIFAYDLLISNVDSNGTYAYNEFSAGFKGKVGDFTPQLAGTFLVNSYVGPLSTIYAGIKSGFNYSYKMLNFGMTYIGAKDTNSGSWNSYGSVVISFSL